MQPSAKQERCSLNWKLCHDKQTGKHRFESNCSHGEGLVFWSCCVEDRSAWPVRGNLCRISSSSQQPLHDALIQQRTPLNRRAVDPSWYFCFVWRTQLPGLCAATSAGSHHHLSKRWETIMKSCRSHTTQQFGCYNCFTSQPVEG